jgi:hypothetical protein
VKLIPTANLKTGDRIRATDEGPKELKTVFRVVSAGRPGYKVAIFEDGTQKAIGHKTGFITVYPESTLEATK